MFKQLLFIILTFTFFFSLNSTLEKNLKKSNNLRIIIPDKYISILSYGYKDILSSILWIDLIQNANTIKDDDPFDFSRSINISTLSPNFYFNYKYNGLMLAIAKDQFLNSNSLLTRGLIHFKDDYHLRYQIGFNYIFLLKDREMGLPIFEHIYQTKTYLGYNPSFPVVYSKILKKTGDIELASRILLNLYDNTKDEKILKIIKNWSGF